MTSLKSLPNENQRLVIWREIHVNGFHMIATIDVKSFLPVCLLTFKPIRVALYK